jgi:lysophospholipase L1-like esterase
VRNDKVNEIIRTYADGESVIWLDFNAKFLESDGTMTKRVMNDLLHPNETGYRIWLDAIEPEFRRLLGK